MSEVTPPATRSPILELSGIGKTFGGVTALTEVDFALLPGEVHGSSARTAPASRR